MAVLRGYKLLVTLVTLSVTSVLNAAVATCLSPFTGIYAHTKASKRARKHLTENAHSNITHQPSLLSFFSGTHYAPITHDLSVKHVSVCKPGRLDFSHN